MFQLNKATDKDEWNSVEIPFSTFQQVRGPRLVQGAPALDASGGLYQIGLSLSKFMISRNVTEIPNFRPGFFELQIKEIGFYTRQNENVLISVPATLSKNEIAKKKPLLLKILVPITKLVFSEKRYVSPVLRRTDVSIGIFCRVLTNEVSTYLALQAPPRLGRETSTSTRFDDLTSDGLRL
jgi:hypothetical protein